MASDEGNYQCATEIREAINGVCQNLDAISDLVDLRPLLATLIFNTTADLSTTPGIKLADRVRGAVGQADLILDFCRANPRK